MASHGALGVTFRCVRIFQAVSLISVVGLTANFVSQVISSNQNAPQIFVGPLSVACLALLYTVITFILYLDSMLPFLVAAIIDGLVLISMIVVAVVIGQPLTYLNCQAIGDPSSSQNMYEFSSALGTTMGQSPNLNVSAFAGASKASCLEMKSVWGLSISLCVLFAFSITCMICLWKRKPVLAGKGGDV